MRPKETDSNSTILMGDFNRCVDPTPGFGLSETFHSDNTRRSSRGYEIATVVRDLVPMNTTFPERFATQENISEFGLVDLAPR